MTVRSGVLRRGLAAALGAGLAGTLAQATPSWPGSRVPPTAARPQDPLAPDVAQGPQAPIGDEPLANDAFLPLAPEAARGFEGGDAALARARRLRSDGREADAARELAAALDGWVAALDAAAPGSWIPTGPAGTPPGEVRAALDPVVLLEGRVAGLAEEERAVWRQRFEPGARAALSEAEDAEALGRVERSYPGTRGAALAALRLADRGLEAGRRAEAGTWLERARRHARLGAELPGAFDEVLLAREALRAAQGAALRLAAADAGAWQRATRLEPLGRLSLGGGPARGLRARPGLAFLGPDRFAIQTEGRVLIVGRRGASMEPESAFDPGELLRDRLGDVPGRARVERDPPGWRLLPVATGGDLVLVVGRNVGDVPNTLACIGPPAPGGGAGVGYPVLRWALSGNWLAGDAVGPERRIVERWSALETAEIQPGPVVLGELVIAQARVYGGEVEAHVLAVDRRTGEPRWSRLLGSGGDLLPDRGRFLEAGATPPRLSAQPLAGSGSLVLVGTNLGLAFLLEAVDGRGLWALRYRRRPAGAEGFPGRRPLAPVPGPGPDGSPGPPPHAPELLLAPFDSDRVYRLAAEELGTEATPVRTVPRELPGARDLVGGGTEDLLVTGEAGAEAAVTTWDEERTARRDAFYLGPAEEFAGAGLLGAGRAYVASDRGLYLLDRRRDLYVLDHEPLVPASPEGVGGGDVYARDDLVVVVGARTVWVFHAE